MRRSYRRDVAALRGRVFAVELLSRQHRRRISCQTHSLGDAKNGVSTPSTAAGPWRGIAFDPAEELTIPETRILRLQYPVILVREIDQPRRYLLGVKRVVVLQRLRCRHAVIKLAVNDERRRLEPARGGGARSFSPPS